MGQTLSTAQFEFELPVPSCVPRCWVLARAKQFVARLNQVSVKVFFVNTFLVSCVCPINTWRIPRCVLTAAMHLRRTMLPWHSAS
jgi:hypothetical protein